MKNHEMSAISPEQVGELIGPITTAVLTLSSAQAQYWVGKKGELAVEISKLLTGAKKLALKHLKFITGDITLATEPFAKNSFFWKSDPVKLSFRDNFTNWVLKEIPKTIAAFDGKLAKFQLTEYMYMYDSAILKELGQPKPFSIDEIGAILPAMLMKQRNGESGDLETNDHANIFYVQLEDRRVVAVIVCWRADNRKWDLNARTLGNVRWFVGRCVFSRSSDV